MDQDQEHNERMGNQSSRSWKKILERDKHVTQAQVCKKYTKRTKEIKQREKLLPSLRLKKGDVSSAVDCHMFLVREGARVHVDSVTVEDICAREPCM